MGCVVPMTSVAVSLSILDSTSTVVDEILLSRIPHNDYPPSIPTLLLNKQPISVGLETAVRPIMQKGCFFISKTENDTVRHAMAEFQHVGEFGKERVYAFGPENYGADIFRSIFTGPIQIHVSARLCCCRLSGSLC
jgi:hypothetical protein